MSFERKEPLSKVGAGVSSFPISSNAPVVEFYLNWFPVASIPALHHMYMLHSDSSCP